MHAAFRYKLSIADVERQKLTSSKVESQKAISLLKFRLVSETAIHDFRVAELEGELRVKTEF